jgi:hypothetical protein
LFEFRNVGIVKGVRSPGGYSLNRLRSKIDWGELACPLLNYYSNEANDMVTEQQKMVYVEGASFNKLETKLIKKLESE